MYPFIHCFLPLFTPPFFERLNHSLNRWFRLRLARAHADMEDIVGAVAAANQALNILGQTSKALIKRHGTPAALAKLRRQGSGSGGGGDSDAEGGDNRGSSGGRGDGGLSFGGSRTVSGDGVAVDASSEACECLHPLYPTLQWQAARLWLCKVR